MGTDTSGSTLPWLEEIGRVVPAPRVRGLPAASICRDSSSSTAISWSTTCAARRPSRSASTTARRSPGSQATACRSSKATPARRRSSSCPRRSFSDFVNELLTANGAVRTGRARVVRGTLAGWQRWEPAIQSLCSGRPIYSAAVWDTLVDRARQLRSTCTVRSPSMTPRTRCAHFLRTAGYLHIRGVFTADEVAYYGSRGRAVPRAHHARRSRSRGGRSTPAARRSSPGSTTSTASRRRSSSSRTTRGSRASPGSPAPTSASATTGSTDRWCSSRTPNVVKGNGDLDVARRRRHRRAPRDVPAHPGGHPARRRQRGERPAAACSPARTATPSTGSPWGDEGDLPVVALDTEPGDLTVHYGDTMHTTPPPTSDDAGRRALYYKFAEPKTFDWIPADCHYNDALFHRDDTGRVAARAETWDDVSPY